MSSSTPLSESAPTSSRPQTPSSGLDDEERRRDIEQAMMSSPTQSDDGQDIEGTTAPGLDEHNGNWTGAGERSSLVYRNDYAAARRLISQAKATPYQRQEAEAFCKVSQLFFFSVTLTAMVSLRPRHLLVKLNYFLLCVRLRTSWIALS